MSNRNALIRLTGINPRIAKVFGRFLLSATRRANCEIGRNSGSIKSNTPTTHQRLAKKRRFSDGTSPLLFDREVLAEADKCERFAAARSMQSRRRPITGYSIIGRFARGNGERSAANGRPIRDRRLRELGRG